ncbi:growth hormone secretagogue receptor type 1-like [Saccostrea cucullata]|uniref:growth hormone secretagogue receptor type 1-like n=1 Tax=Saccostrea cuccullata TaxID=36930 RepID=UPI002ED02B37
MLNHTTRNFSYVFSIPEPPKYIIIVASVMYSLIFIAGFIANISVVVVVCAVKRVRSRMSFLFANLSVADLLVLLVCMPSAAIDLFAKEVWYLGEFMCKFVPFVEHLVSLASVLTILVITYDRYRGVCYPMSSGCFWSNLRVPTVVFLVWILAGAASLPITFIAIFRDSKFFDGTPIKVCRMPINSSWKIAYILGIFIFFFIVILMVLCFLIFRMCKKLLWHAQFLEDRAEQDSEKTVSGRRRIVFMLIIVIVTFFLCLLPQRIVGIWIIVADHGELHSLGLEGYLNLITFPRVLMYISSASNPIIYNIMSAKFKTALRDILCHCKICTECHSPLPRLRDRTSSFHLSRLSLSSRGTHWSPRSRHSTGESFHQESKVMLKKDRSIESVL